MKISELRQMTDIKLLVNLRLLRRQLSVVKFHIKTGKEGNTAKVSDLRKGIARTFTLLNKNK